MIYFDNSATTKIAPEALQTMIQVMQTYYGNPSSLHKLGTESAKLLNSARKQVADLLGAQSPEIFFTSGGTESNNWAIKGTAMEKVKYHGNHIIVSSVEHPSVRNTMETLSQNGFEITYLPADKSGKVHVEDVAAAIKETTILVSVMAVNNEIGAIQPIAEIGDLLESYPTIHYHVDGVQSIGTFEKPLIHDRVDLMSFSAHKFNGPRGIGILYKKQNRVISQLLDGGGQEMGQRSTTENLAGIAATAKALRMALAEAKDVKAKEAAMQEKLRAFFAEHADLVQVFSPEDAAPHVLCFALKGVRGEVMVHALEDENIIVSTTSACSSRAVNNGSSTLGAMKVDPVWAKQAIRLSFGKENTMAEVDQFIEVYTKLMKKFERIQ
ncbi:cysteine desulfurase family protein [Aerococcus viridans]|uniref:cysteine desulfurase family protein n=1 Tax=Aerococcus viridans TaxID=1377 RepID=UPI002DB7D6F9|nr:cysteine desulfurase family protein [Aerococcus viridans]MEC1386805.1 cysteine desulfurase family protein [Aerococcus viridans]